MKNILIKSTVISLVSLTFSATASSAETIALDNVTVKANRFERKDTDTTYASEIQPIALNAKTQIQLMLPKFILQHRLRLLAQLHFMITWRSKLH